MSLKALHIVFVTASTLTAFFSGFLLLQEYGRSHNVVDLVYSVLCWLTGVALIWYGRVIWRKLKRISFL